MSRMLRLYAVTTFTIPYPTWMSPRNQTYQYPSTDELTSHEPSVLNEILVIVFECAYIVFNRERVKREKK